MKRTITVLIVIVILFASFLPVATANEDPNNHILTADDILGSDHFESLTREEYISNSAIANGISYEEAETIIDEKINNALSQIPAPTTWYPDSSIDNGDTTATVYGNVKFEYYVTFPYMHVTYKIPAILIQSHYGSTWIHIDPHICLPGSGTYEYEDFSSASIISPRIIRLNVSGYFQIEDGIDISINLEQAGFTLEIGGNNNRYWRKVVDTVFTETTSVQGG